jgi:multidrug efflux system membrane fusion protein
VSRQMAVATWVLAPILLLTSACQAQKAQSAGGPPAVPVSIAPVTQESVPIEVHAVGRVEPSAVIQVKSLVAGEIVRVAFTEGAIVNQGDLLFEIDPRQYQQALRQAEATLARDTAQLHQAEANVNRDKAQAQSADADAARNRQLHQEGLASGSQEEQSRASAESIRASIAADEAAVESSRAAAENDRAAIDRARLDLSYCQIHSPVSGRAGILLIQQGNLVGANGTPLVSINQVTPIWVTFNAPESFLAEIRRNSADRKLPVKAVPRDNAGHSVDGVLSVIDNTVDTTTGTIRLRASFDNRTGFLWPGQFADVTLTLGALNRALVVPAEAVQPGQNGQMVYVVKADQTVEPRVVTVGTNVGNKVTIQSGLSAGENVVTDGQLRLFPGAHIRAVPASKMDSQAL